MDDDDNDDDGRGGGDAGGGHGRDDDDDDDDAESTSAAEAFADHRFLVGSSMPSMAKFSYEDRRGVGMGDGVIVESMRPDDDNDDDGGSDQSPAPPDVSRIRPRIDRIVLVRPSSGRNMVDGVSSHPIGVRRNMRRGGDDVPSRGHIRQRRRRGGVEEERRRRTREGLPLTSGAMAIDRPGQRRRRRQRGRGIVVQRRWRWQYWERERRVDAKVGDDRCHPPRKTTGGRTSIVVRRRRRSLVGFRLGTTRGADIVESPTLPLEWLDRRDAMDAAGGVMNIFD